MKLAAPTALLFATLLHSALAAPAAEAVPNLLLEERSPKSGKIPKGGSGNDTSNAASDLIAPSRLLQGVALGLGIAEVVRLWG
ncbi:hypothetical protein GMOD_00006431 [Pyrenophora seminiperda CCB06]|uniref:Uncharacterized protein n=1 Tax=Pyrenophora seminiperda CCB06 TaxID=1302712 RepID=A0A3M7M566_9PLEO|nr:hypothetical protein GMOD_00006431 [Pyrenophora seminiperda CCB06]